VPLDQPRAARADFAGDLVAGALVAGALVAGALVAGALVAGALVAGALVTLAAERSDVAVIPPALAAVAVLGAAFAPAPLVPDDPAAGTAFFAARATGPEGAPLVAATARRPAGPAVAAALVGTAFAALATLPGSGSRDAVARTAVFGAGALAIAAEAFAVEAFAAEAFAAEAVARTGLAFAAAALRPDGFLALRSALKPVAGLKRIPFEAAIFTAWPVRGLRPVRALRDVGLKLPKP